MKLTGDKLLAALNSQQETAILVRGDGSETRGISPRWAAAPIVSAAFTGYATNGVVSKIVADESPGLPVGSPAPGTCVIIADHGNRRYTVGHRTTNAGTSQPLLASENLPGLSPKHLECRARNRRTALPLHTNIRGRRLGNPACGSNVPDVRKYAAVQRDETGLDAAYRSSSGSDRR